MPNALTVDLPHQLGRAEAARRMKARIGELPSHIPGGVASIENSWPSEDRMALALTAMGQQVSADIEVQDALIRVHLALPPMLGFMSGAIAGAIRAQGGTLLLGDDTGRKA